MPRRSQRGPKHDRLRAKSRTDRRRTTKRAHAVDLPAQSRLGPIAGGLILDLVDLTTFGPLWASADSSSVRPSDGGSVRSTTSRQEPTALWALSAGAYCLMPLTEFLPIATIISAVARFEEHPKFKEQQEKSEAADQEAGSEGREESS